MACTNESTRSAILSALQQAENVWLSGEKICATLGISRAAVSKHIRHLREQGYSIESAPRRGYLLLHEADLLTAEAVQPGLQTTTFGKSGYVYLPTTQSTNMEAMARAIQGAPEGTVIVADEQTGGRGRKGRVWASPAGAGLYISLILRPDIPPEAAPIITLLANVVTAETILSLTGVTPVCKWPNDVLIKDRKVSGNLTESFLIADSVGHVVTGTGINISAHEKSLPQEMRSVATSLQAASGNMEISRKMVLHEYLQQYERWYTTFTHEGISPVMRRWKTLTNVLGQYKKVVVRNNMLEGEIIDVDTDGFLLLREKTGKIHRLFSGDILDE